MIKYTIPMRGIPKPRGRLSRNGHIYHSHSKYVEWTKDFNRYLRVLNFQLAENQTIAVNFNLKRNRGAKPDLDNLMGSVLDALVKGNFIEDDNYTIIPRLLVFGEVSEVNTIEIFVADTKKDLYNIIDRLL